MVSSSYTYHCPECHALDDRRRRFADRDRPAWCFCARPPIRMRRLIAPPMRLPESTATCDDREGS